MQKSRSANLGRAFLRGLLSIILLLSCSVALRAQSTYGALTGTVIDSTGAVAVRRNRYAYQHWNGNQPNAAHRRHRAVFLCEPDPRQLSPYD